MTSTPPPTSGDSSATPTPDAEPGSAALPTWLAEAADLLGLPADAVPVTLLLELARDAAHGVARPAAPLTTFLAGLAAGRAGGSAADVEAAVAALTARLDGRQDRATRSAPA